VSNDGVLTERVDSASDRAVYRQIADHLRTAIARGRVRESERLPSEAQLMEHYGVTRVTIRNALRVLQDEGLTVAGLQGHAFGAPGRPAPELITRGERGIRRGTA
jgi:GntR family transcriptional regulator